MIESIQVPGVVEAPAGWQPAPEGTWQADLSFLRGPGWRLVDRYPGWAFRSLAHRELRHEMYRHTLALVVWQEDAEWHGYVTEPVGAHVSGTTRRELVEEAVDAIRRSCHDPSHRFRIRKRAVPPLPPLPANFPVR